MRKTRLLTNDRGGALLQKRNAIQRASVLDKKKRVVVNSWWHSVELRRFWDTETVSDYFLKFLKFKIRFWQMTEDREVLREVWQGRIPASFAVTPEEVTTSLNPENFYLMLPRLSYFALCTEKVIAWMGVLNNCHFCLHYFDRLQFHEKNCHFCLHYFYRLQFPEKNCQSLNFAVTWKIVWFVFLGCEFGQRHH